MHYICIFFKERKIGQALNRNPFPLCVLEMQFRKNIFMQEEELNMCLDELIAMIIMISIRNFKF